MKHNDDSQSEVLRALKESEERSRTICEHASETDLGSEIILLVEDEAPIRRAAKAFLEDSGYQVLTAADGVEALEIIRSRPDGIDLVVTDVIMPRMSGPQLYEAVRDLEHPPRFLFTSGYPTRDNFPTAELNESVRIFSKPWSADDLLREIRSALDATGP